MTWATAAVLPALVVSALSVGCSGDNKTDTGGGPAKDSVKEKKDDKDKGGKKKKEPLASTGTGTLKGRVTLAGDKPDIAGLNAKITKAIDEYKDKKDCLEAPEHEKDEQVWRIGQNNGVENVFVWLAPPAGKYFKVDMDKPTWPKEVELKQPHCAFLPHAFVLFPGTELPEAKSSGQKFVITNDAKFLHNTNWTGGDANPNENKAVPAGSKITAELKPDSSPVHFKCNVHGWMSAVARVFDHPYATVTDKDGNFEIKDAPAGAELNVIVWHEEGGFGSTGKDGKKLTLEAGKDTKEDFTVSAAK